MDPTATPPPDPQALSPQTLSTLPADKAFPFILIRPGQQRPVGRVAGLFDLWDAALIARHANAVAAVQAFDEVSDMIVLSCLVAGPPMTGGIDDYAFAAILAGEAQVNFKPRAIEQIFERFVIFLARQPAEWRYGVAATQIRTICRD